MNQRVHMATKSILLSNWISLIRMKKQEWHGCDKCRVVDANIKCFCCQNVEALEYFKLLGTRNGDTSAVTV